MESRKVIVWWIATVIETNITLNSMSKLVFNSILIDKEPKIIRKDK